MIHPDTELRFIDDAMGYGVFATKLIPKGTITYVKDSLEIEISPENFFNHSPVMQDVIDKYSYKDEKGYRIISWDTAKYVNHCCHCNTISTGYGFEFALRDIQPGEQITDEYGLFNIEKDMEIFCGRDGCRKVLRNSDFDIYSESWDEKIKQSLPALFEVEQPLFHLLEAEMVAELESFRKNPIEYRSVQRLKYKTFSPVTVSRMNGTH
jgi:hypothetical protein